MIAQARVSNPSCNLILNSSSRSLSVVTSSHCHPAGTTMPRKTLHLMRHGQTEMNMFLGANEGNWFDDPLLFDTVLSARGQHQVAKAQAETLKLSPQPQLIVSSPLTRALQTAEAAFKHTSCRRSVCHWAAERIYHASDVGTEVSKLKPLWPSWDFTDIPSVWWHTRDPENLTLVSTLSAVEFDTRVQNLIAWLNAQPEDCIALVSHWGVLRSVCQGKEFSNAELHTITLESE